MIQKKNSRLYLLIGLLAFLPVQSVVWASDDVYWEYTIQKGDNLWSFSERHLISPAYAMKLKSFNKIPDAYHIKPNMKIKVPLEWGKKVDGQAAVFAVTGKVNIELKNKQHVAATVGLALPSGSRISTGKDSQATLKFTDGSRLILNSGTTIVLGSQIYYPTTGASANTINLERGSVNGNIERPPLMKNRYEVKTKTAITAVRGTELDVGVDDVDDTRASVFSGHVDVIVGDNVVELKQGFGSRVGKESKHQTEPLLPPSMFEHGAQVFTDNLPIVSWKVQPKAKKYRVELYPEAERSNLIWVRETTTSNMLIPAPRNGKYAVRVYAIPDSGLLGLPARTTFEYKAHPLPPVVLAPAAVDVYLGKTIPLKIGRSAEFKAYKLQLAQDKQFQKNAQVIDIEPQEKMSFQVPETGVWYWRVAAVSKNGQTGSYSATNTLRVGAILVKDQVRQSLRVSPVTLSGVQYQLDLYQSGDKTRKVLYSTIQSEPEWSLRKLSKGKYIACISYLIDGKVTYITPEQEIDW